MRLIRRRSSDLSNAALLRTASSRRKSALWAAVGAVALLGGCEVKSFLDPTEMGRMEMTPLAMPILRNLDTGIEEPDTTFLSATDPTPADLVASDQDYRISRGDLINVSITDLQAPGVETVKTARVTESGKISLPYIGQVPALGRTEAELEQDIVGSYKSGGLIQNAQVSVTVSEYRGRTFSILGSVGQPGEYAIVESDFRVLDALVQAHDVNVSPMDVLYIVRRGTPAAGQPATGGPTTAPASGADPLAPHADASTRLPLYLQAAGAATAPAPADALSPVQPDGHYVTIDGKQVLIQTDGHTASGPVANPAMPTTAPSSDAAPATAPAPAGLADRPMPPAPAPASFEFNAPASTANQRIIKIDLKALRRGDLKQNVVVQPHDLIMVPIPETGEYYMGGHVTRSGVYSLTNRNITLKQAVISAGMLDQLAIPQRTDIIRRVGAEREVYARVDLAKIFEGAQPDIYLKPNDVVQVGTNFLAPFLAAVRSGFRITYGFGFLYDRNFAYNNNNQSI